MKDKLKRYTLRIFRGNPGDQHWEDFSLDYVEGENVISALMRIRKNPVTDSGEKVDPVTWEDGCLEEVCGSCSMLINGKPRQACAALIRELVENHGLIIKLAPLSKFPLVRDLMVDRTVMFENLKKVQAWVESDTYLDPKKFDKHPQDRQQIRYSLSACMTCGCCSEACPQVSDKSDFIGPAAIAQSWLFNLHSTEEYREPDRLNTLMGKGGISSCGNAQNCVRVCPKNVPLTDAISSVSRAVSKHMIQKAFGIQGAEK